MKKRLISMLMGAALVAGTLAGCGSAAETSAPAAEAPKAETPAAETKAEEAPAAETKTEEAAPAESEPVNLKWALWDIDSTVYYQPLIDAYTAIHPEVTIEMVDLGSTDYSTVLGTQLAGSGSDFDVVTIKDVPGLVSLVNRGVLEPLDDRIAADGVDMGLYNGVTDQVMLNGNNYELPFRSDVWVLFYNKDVFDNAGVDYPTNDMTWEEYDALARKVADPAKEIYGTHYHTWRSTIQLMGILDGKNSIIDGTYDFTKPYYEMVLGQQNDEICMDYATLKTQGLHYSGAFAQGNIAMMNMGSWFIPTLITKIDEGEYTECTNWGMVKYPHAAGVEPGSTLSTITALALPTSAPNKDAAWDFIKFVSGTDGAKVMAGTGNTPAIFNDEIVNLIAAMPGFPEDDNSKQALITSHTYLEMPASEKSSDIETVLNQGHEDIMTGEKSIDEAIEEMNAGVQAVLAQ